MVSLKNIITHILQEHGFDAYEREGILFGQKGSQLVSVGIFNTPSIDHLHEYAQAVYEKEGTHIFCIPGEAGEEAKAYAAQQGIVIWNKSDLEREIGQAIIAHAAASEASTFHELLQARVPEPATKENDAAAVAPTPEGSPPDVEASPPEHEEPTPAEPSPDADAMDISDVIVAESIETRSPEEAPTADEAPPSARQSELPPAPEAEALPAPETRHLPEPDTKHLPEPDTKHLPVYVEGLGSEDAPKVVQMKLTLDDVKEISGKTVEGFKHELELVPHYLFEYLCIFEGKDGAERKNRGIIAVNAFTGKYSAWDEEPEFTDEVDTHHVRLEPKIDEPAAKSVAMQGIIETNREHDEVIVERDHATIIEKAVFAPKEENIVLEKRGLVMVPVWCVEGSHGVMILDGTTGKIISEDYYQESRE